MQTIRYIMSGVAGLLLLNSCVKDELYKTPHPDKGRITITADWSHRLTDCPLPEEYVLQHSCCEGKALKAPVDREFCHPSLFEPKSHTLIAWNEPAIPERVPVMFEMRSGSPSLTVSSNNKSRVFCFM